MNGRACWAVLLAAALAAPALAAPHRLVENFTSALPSNGEVQCQADFENAKVGLACGRISYKVHPQHRRAWLELGQERVRVAAPGLLDLWVKGDASGNELQICLQHAEVSQDDQGNRRLSGHQDLWLPRVKLDFTDWRQIAFDARQIPQGRSIWWNRLVVYAPQGDKARLEGTLLLDDFRVTPSAGQPAGTVAIGLIGPQTRDFSADVALFLDARNFTRTAAKVRARVIMTDRNENPVVDRDFQFEIAVGEQTERKLQLAPDKLETYLPPFGIDCDVVSDVPELTAHTSLKMVMANARVLFDDLSDVYGRWFTAGSASDSRDWMGWLQGEGPRYSPLLQTSARISRVTLPGGQPAGEGKGPPCRCAMQVDFTGEAAVFSSRMRYMPGNPFQFGVWVKGDGSGARLSTLVLDYTDNADFWPGGWRRIGNGKLPLCSLDFTDWRYVEVALPGNGIGANTPRGSTHALDYPLELTCFIIEPVKDKPSGSILLGPMLVTTQQSVTEGLAVHIGYDDPERRYAPERNAWVTIQNSSRTGKRQVDVNWTLLDRSDEVIAKGRFDLPLAAGEVQTRDVKLSEHANEITGKAAPLRLQVVATDSADVTVTTRRELILARPDSVALVSDFESDRGYLGLKAWGISNAPPAGRDAARTSTDQARSGKRSLALSWDKQKRRALFVSVDPALPGVPTELSLWLHGDGSGVMFYPLIGDQYGVSHGAPNAQWDMFLPRVEGGQLQNAVRVDWKGWRELRFLLPVIPPAWNQELPVLGFEPSYPLGVHLAVDASSGEGESGILYVDDIAVRTHLKPEQRMTIDLRREGKSDVVAPGSRIEVVASNCDAQAPRKAHLSGGVFDWRGRRVSGIDSAVDLASGERKTLTVASGLKTGAYSIRLDLTDAGRTLGRMREDLLVADLAAVLGADWQAALEDEWRLRAPTRDCFALVDEDWDWVEHFPGNVQLDTLRGRAQAVKALGGRPHVLLGYSAYWASGVGLEQVKSGAFVRLPRDAGHAVNTFMVPARMEDWDDYVCELMRGTGREVGGWIIWNNPDGIGPLAVRPETLAQMLKLADKWRRTYCPETPFIIGGMGPDTAIPYISELSKQGALDSFTGVNVRLDVGRLSPEDAEMPAYVRTLQNALGAGTPKTILLTDLDWAVEKGEQGLDTFDQAAYLARSDLLLSLSGITPAVSIRNEDCERLGLGLTYRPEVTVPPLTERPAAFHFKPSWWAIVRTRQWLERIMPVGEIEVQDIVPKRTRCLLYERKDGGGPVAVVWRVNDLGEVSFQLTGMAIEAAEDVFGSEVPARGGWHAVGKFPVVFALKASQEAPAQALTRVRVRDGDEAVWPQLVLAVFTPATGASWNYAQEGGQAAELVSATLTGEPVKAQGLKFAPGGIERFRITATTGQGMVLRKRFLLDGTGQEAEVLVNGQTVGVWNLKRSEEKLSGGVRDTIFMIDKAALAGKGEAAIEVRYKTAANTIQWCALECPGGSLPLSAVGPMHSDQNVGHLRLARSMAGTPLKVVEKPFANGIGVFARSLLEYPLNRQFRTFKAKVGVDAVTEGRGSVVFEVQADGRKLWASPVMSGLDEAKEVSLDVTGVDRLRLIVGDAGDGSRFDAADWCEPVLER